MAAYLPRPAQCVRNEAILRAKVLQELDKGSRFLEQRVQRMFPGPAGMLLNPLAGIAWRSVGREEIVRRARHQLDVLLAAAQTHGGAPEAIFDGHLTAYLKQDEAFARANRAHARFQEFEGLVREVYVARVEPLSLLVHRGLGESYPDLVRSVFPTRDTASRVIEREFLYADRILQMAEKEEGLLYMPPLVGREVFGVLRDAYEWYKGCVHRGLDGIYAEPALSPN